MQLTIWYFTYISTLLKLYRYGHPIPDFHRTMRVRNGGDHVCTTYGPFRKYLYKHFFKICIYLKIERTIRQFIKTGPYVVRLVRVGYIYTAMSKLILHIAVYSQF